MATAKPSVIAEWATQDEVDVVTGAANKVAPTAQFVLSGQKRRQPVIRPYLNYTLNNHGEWIKYISEQLAGLGTPILEAAYPIGTIYENKTDGTNPATLLGFGTWAPCGTGRFLVGIDGGQVEFDTAGKTGGAKTHSHSVSGATAGHAITIEQMPSHIHSYSDIYYIGSAAETAAATNKFLESGYNGEVGSGSTDYDNDTFLYRTETTNSTGGSETHSHNVSITSSTASSLPPYEVVYRWYRTA